ncbi:MAG: Multidrug resistance protein MdtA precursor [Syntrophorhabdus sp. PtaU1.Bin050]|nr:MAG: Multidrug resistance protein MdtA precursor [Syntrophorhabdus sp. PtaU1.Bin050]
MKHAFPVLCIVIALLVAGCKDKVKPGFADVKRQVISGITVTKISLTSVDSYYETSGTVRAKTVSIIASRVMGTVRAIQVKEGDKVKAGDLLLTLDDRDMAQRTAAAEAGFKEALMAQEAARQSKALADITYQRYKNLHVEKAVTGQEMDQVETKRKIAGLEYERSGEAVSRSKALLAEANVYLGFTKIRAPQSGVVTEKRIDVGSMASPGTPLMTIEDTSRFRVEAPVDERLSGIVKAGTPAHVDVAAMGRRLTGNIAEVIPAVNPASRTFLVKIDLNDPSLKPGLYGKVLIPEDKKEVLLVPKGAIAEKGQLSGVYVVDDKGVIAYHLIREGKSYGDRIEILSGLKAGDTIIVGGVDRAIDGGIVRR